AAVRSPDLLGTSSAKPAFRFHIEHLLGVQDIVGDQRLGDDNPEAIALARSALSYIYDKLLENNLPVDGSLSRQQFNSLFGARPVVAAGGYASRFSRFIHKCLAFAGMDKSNIALALEGSYCSPDVKPVVAIGDKILGLIISDEYITGYNPAKHTFTIDEALRSSIEEDLFVDSKYLDEDKVNEYFGRPLESLIFSYGNFFGHGDAFLRNVMQLKGLPEAEQVPFSQLAFGEMAAATDKTKSNASFICYLKMVSGDYLAVSGGKEASRNDKKELSLESIKGKGNFFKMGSRLVSYTDWEQIPHKSDMNQDNAGYDHVFSQQAENQKTLEGELKNLPGDPAARAAKLTVLRAQYPYFLISDEGEFFSQENIAAILTDLNNWKDLSQERKSYLMRHYAVVDKGASAEILISSNTGIFRNDAVWALNQGIQDDFKVNDFASYAKNPSSDSRISTAFWGVDPKNNETKTLTWNLIRMIADDFMQNNSGKECPVDLCYVGKAPSSIKDAQLQLAFAEGRIKDHSLPESAAPESPEALSILDKIKSNKLDEAVNDVLNNDIASYRRLLRELFAVTSRDRSQSGLLKLAGMLEAELNRLISQGNTRTQSTRAPPEVLLGLTIQALAEAIDRGQVANDMDLLINDSSYRQEAFALRQRFAESSKQSKKSEYLIWRLGHILVQVLRTQRDGDTLEALLKEAPALSGVRQQIQKTLFVTGGTALGTLYVEALGKAGLLGKGDIYGAVGNVDDGGSSYTIVNNLNQAGYGIIPPPGDQVNGAFGFASQDKRAHLLGDGGRVDKKSKAKTILEGTLPLVWATLGDEGVELEDDFFYFVRVLAAAIGNIDNLNDTIKKADEASNAANPQAKPQDNRISIPGASVRNIFLLGFLHNEGFFGKPSYKSDEHKSAVETPAEQGRYAAALDNMVRACGIGRFQMSVSSFDPHTLYCIHRDNTLLIRKNDGSIDSLLLRAEGGKVIVSNPLAYPHINKELTVGDSAALKDLGIVLGLANDIRIENQSGMAVISFMDKEGICQSWRVEEDSDLNHTYIVNTLTGERIELAADGTGRAKQYEGEKDAKALLEAENGVELFLRNRLIKMQTNITETINHSKVVDFGFLDGYGLAGVLPQDRINNRVYGGPNNPFIDAIKTFKEGDIIFIGPGSFFSSILSHFMVEGLPEALKEAKDHGAKVVFVVNANYDNETVNTTFTEQMKFLEDISKFKINEMFSHIVASRSDVLELEDGLKDDFNNGNGRKSGVIAEELIAKIKASPCAYCHIFSMTKGFLKKYADPQKKEDYIQGAENAYCLKKVIDNRPLMEKLAEDYSILINTLYKDVHPEIRTDPSKAAEAAKYSRGPMVLTPQDRDLINSCQDLTLREHSFISYIRVQKREAGKFTDRIGYDTDIMSELLQEACGIRKALYVAINGVEYHQDQSPLVVYGDKIEVVATRTLPSTIDDINYKDIKEMSAAIELSRGGNKACEAVSCPGRTLDIRGHQIAFDPAKIENVEPGVYKLKVTTRCMCGEKPDFHQESFSIEVRSGDVSPAVGAVVATRSSSQKAPSQDESLLKPQEAEE
ncbi:MAG: 2-phospho-L-lactate transferase CofD family protein, partial [Candidatus Omnitrophica bacterium]|nr:2-phospho-L-lactate transferase CofD family protein [Candidatus Omnitrophota bacterium]